MKNNKVAILTHYYRSVNYGGTLQAYALARFLNDNGFDAKQVSYAGKTKTNLPKEKISFIKKAATFIRRLTRIPFSAFKRVRYKKAKIEMEKIITKRMKVFDTFREENIPHTIDVYDENLQVLNHDFDIFITGSDQVFNFNFFRKGYFLGFVEKSKKKIAYAASMASTHLSEENALFFKKSLNDFYAISVREPEAMEYIDNLLGQKKALVCVDPTFLIKPEQWKTFASKRLFKEDYCFCYFLGSNQQERIIAKSYSKEHNFIIIGIPMYRDNYHFTDHGLFDVSVSDASPNDFVSLIMNANCVFTDSFHACVFSILFNKKFVVFKREENDNMTSRISSLLKTYNLSDCFICSKGKNAMMSAKRILDLEQFYDLSCNDSTRSSSIEFLINSCNGD